MLPMKLSALAVVVGALLLSGCGDSKTNIVEREPIPVEDDHDHDHDHDSSNAGRLIISDKSSALVSVFELKDNSLIDTFNLTETPASLYASPTKRYAVAVQRTQDLVQFIDSGLYQEDHGDHLHDYQQPPALVSFSLHDSRPTHVTANDSQLAVFFDGDANNGTPAAVAVVTDNDIGQDRSGYPVLHYSVHMHGAAQARGEFLLSTVREASAGSTLPDSVALYHQHGDHYHQELVFAEPCPGLHGSAQNEQFAGFGCTDGVLLVEQTGNTFAATKVANSPDFSGTMRIGTLVGDHHAEHFVGFAGINMFAIDTEHGAMSAVDWQNTAGATLTGYAFAAKAEKFVLLDSQGYLTIFDYHGHSHTGEPAFSLAAKVQLTTADVATMPQGSRFELAVSGSDDNVYITNPIDSTLLTVDLDEAKVSQVKQLNFIPHKLVWLGVAEAAGHHDH